jgi:phage N-6-adenine-methyltransferase
MRNALMFSTGKDDWQTPPELFAALDAEFYFAMDVAADDKNRLTACWLGPGHTVGGPSYDDALSVEWPAARSWGPCWCNPPYSRGLQSKFIAKAALERTKGVTTVMLLPARTDTKAFHDHVWDAEKHQPREGVEVRFLKGRLKFSGAKDAAPFPSMIVVFRGQPEAAGAADRRGDERITEEI